jgi:hypothetical protein
MVTVVGWVLGVQTVIAAPLWAIMHMRPSQTFVGSEAQGYLLLMALFVRPAWPSLACSLRHWLLTLWWTTSPRPSSPCAATLQLRPAGSVCCPVHQFFWWFIAFGGLLLPVLFMIYGLPQVLPDRVLAWLNVGVHDLGATSASSEMRSNLSSQARSPGAGAPKESGSRWWRSHWWPVVRWWHAPHWWWRWCRNGSCERGWSRCGPASGCSLREHWVIYGIRTQQCCPCRCHSRIECRVVAPCRPVTPLRLSRKVASLAAP